MIPKPWSNPCMFRVNKQLMIDKMQRQQGFTLIEVMIALAILSILVSLAVPNYREYTQRVRRDDATHLLMLNAHRLQRCFTLEGVYNGSCVTRPLSKDGYYSLTVNSTSNTFSLSALPVAGTSQAKDAGCESFVYDHTGLQTATGTDADRCW